jgi:hypothetical protein
MGIESHPGYEAELFKNPNPETPDELAKAKKAAGVTNADKATMREQELGISTNDFKLVNNSAREFTKRKEIGSANEDRVNGMEALGQAANIARALHDQVIPEQERQEYINKYNEYMQSAEEHFFSAGELYRQLGNDKLALKAMDDLIKLKKEAQNFDIQNKEAA